MRDEPGSYVSEGTMGIERMPHGSPLLRLERSTKTVIRGASARTYHRALPASRPCLRHCREALRSPGHAAMRRPTLPDRSCP